MVTDHWRMTIGKCPTCGREGLVHSFRYDLSAESWDYVDAECTFGCPVGSRVRSPALDDLSRPLRMPRR